MQARHLPVQEYLLMIDPKEIVLSTVIGEGSFGRVWSGRWVRNDVAVKEFVFAQAAIEGNSLQRGSIIEEIVGEACIMACLRHPKILQLYGCTLTMQAIWIVSELCEKGSLRMVLNQKNIKLPLVKKLSMCLDVADGMLYLHTRTPPIIHRDLKSHNLFVQEPSAGHYVAKIGDWGSARAVALSGAKSMTQGVGTACWLAPEVINYAHSSKASDIYAFGIVLWEVYTRQEVHDGLSAAQIIAKVAHEGLRPMIPRDCPWAKIMTECWNENPNNRPDFNRIHSNLADLYAILSKKSSQSSNHSTSLSHNLPLSRQPSSSSSTHTTNSFLGEKDKFNSHPISSTVTPTNQTVMSMLTRRPSGVTGSSFIRPKHRRNNSVPPTGSFTARIFTPERSVLYGSDEREEFDFSVGEELEERERERERDENKLNSYGGNEEEREREKEEMSWMSLVQESPKHITHPVYPTISHTLSQSPSSNTPINFDFINIMDSNDIRLREREKDGERERERNKHMFYKPIGGKEIEDKHTLPNKEKREREIERRKGSVTTEGEREMIDISVDFEQARFLSGYSERESECERDRRREREVEDSTKNMSSLTIDTYEG